MLTNSPIGQLSRFSLFIAFSKIQNLCFNKKKKIQFHFYRNTSFEQIVFSHTKQGFREAILVRMILRIRLWRGGFF